MPDRALVGRCGLYCGACGIYRAYKDGGVIRERIAGSFNIQSEQVRCDGCQALSPGCWGYDCEIVQCLSTKGFSFCYQCEDYASRRCEKFENLARRYAERGMDLRTNLARIAAGEVEEWLAEQEERWRCPACGQPISCHEDHCHHCGAPLTSG